MRLDDLLTGSGIDAVLHGNYLRDAAAHPGGAERIAAACDFASLSRLVTAAPAREVLLSCAGRPIDRPAGPADPVRWLADGWSVAVRHGERIDPRLNIIAAGFAAALLGPIDIQVHATPAGRTGFGWHYDPEEVFVVQCAGAKEWLVRRNTVNPDPVREAMPRDLQFQRESSPLLRVRLDPGDWLYIPGGWWHVATAAESDSLSLSIGIEALTPLALLDALRADLVRDPRWRRRLAPGVTAAGDPSLARIAEELGQRLADPGLPVAYAATQRRAAARLLTAAGRVTHDAQVEMAEPRRP